MAAGARGAREYHGSVAAACLGATGAAETAGRRVLAGLAGKAATAGHVLAGLALPECRARAGEYLDERWAREPRWFVSLWWEEREPLTRGLLEGDLEARGPAALELFGSSLDSGDLRPAAAGYLAWRGREAAGVDRKSTRLNSSH